MQTTEFYFWQSCPELNFHSTRQIKLHQYITTSQQSFAEKFDFPYFNLIPNTQLYKDHSDNFPAFNIKSRIIEFEVGFTIYEIQYSVKGNTELTKSNQITIDGSKLFGKAIGTKKENCVNYIAGKGLCDDCESNRVIPGPKLLSHANQNLQAFAELNTRGKKQMETTIVQNFGDCQIYVDGNKFYLFTQKISNNKRKHILESLKLGIWLLFGQVSLGLDIFQTNQAKLINAYRSQVDHTEFTELRNRFIQTFLFIFYWAHPDFLCAKTGVRLHLKTLELTIFRKLSKLVYTNFPTLDPELVQQFTKLPLGPLMDISVVTRRLPGHHLAKWKEFVSPINIIPHWPLDISDSINQEENKMVLALANYLREEIKKSGRTKINPLSQLGVVTVNKAAELFGKTPGSASEPIKKLLNSLADKDILVYLHRKEVLVKKTKAKDYYLLNPQLPLTSMILNSAADIL